MSMSDQFERKKMTSSFIEARHFFNHSCQDEMKSCFTQAQNLSNLEADKNPSVLDHMEPGLDW